MIPSNCKYTKEHEWARKEGNKVVVGVTEYAAKQLGDVVFVDMPKVGTKVESGKTLGVIESVKTVSDVYAPVSGIIVNRNSELETDPALVNKDPYGKGWIVEIEPNNPSDYDKLLSSQEYEEYLKSCHG